MSITKITMYTDGSCLGNPGPGGWAALLIHQDTEKMIYGVEEATTNNRMELTAAIEGLKSLKRKCHVDLHTDSNYVKQGITEWIKTWKKKNWKNSARKPVKNQDLWQALDKLVEEHEVHWHWVKAHSGIALNERVDEQARAAIDELL